MVYDVVIIGGGVAGSTAALFAVRNRSKVLLIDKGCQYGILGTLSKVMDFPGFPEGISGPDLFTKIRKQVEDAGVEVKTASVTACVLDEKYKRVITNEPVTYETHEIILTTGNLPQQNLQTYQGEKELVGRGVSHDVEMEAPACKHAAVALVGKTVATAEAAVYLSNFAEKIYWVIPASKLDLPDKLRDELNQIKKIEAFFSSSLKKINGTTEVTSVSVLTAGQEQTLSVKHLFLPPLQYRPITDYLSGTGVEMNQEGCVMINQNMETSIKGIFAAGNILCAKPQINVVCAAQGAIAALNAKAV